jgi:hypothetical protein
VNLLVGERSGTLGPMSNKTICDGCFEEIKTWNARDPSAGDGLTRTLRLVTGTNCVQWDLCDPCQGKVASALVELLPKTPRESWWDAIRPTKRA